VLFAVNREVDPIRSDENLMVSFFRLRPGPFEGPANGKASGSAGGYDCDYRKNLLAYRHESMTISDPSVMALGLQDGT